MQMVGCDMRRCEKVEKGAEKGHKGWREGRMPERYVRHAQGRDSAVRPCMPLAPRNPGR